jgi:ABC-type molybdate transport system permease subunit
MKLLPCLKRIIAQIMNIGDYGGALAIAGQIGDETEVL